MTTRQIKELSLTHGWVPALLTAAVMLAVLAATGWRTRRWRMVWIPVAIIVGVLLAMVARWYVGATGITGSPAPVMLWVWVAVFGGACVVAASGWQTSRWWRRGLSLLAVPLSMVCVAAEVNGWLGYVPTVGAAWTEITANPLPEQIDRARATAMQLSNDVPAKGVLMSVTIDSAASHFDHRNELVYAPPAWFTSFPPPALPTVMMIGGEFNTPTDWIRAGDAIATVDAFAARHAGLAPLLVFVDSGGRFDTDTECVNGTRGNAADHLTKDVVPFMESSFGVSRDPAWWAVVGFSSGGTCAIDLTVMHPELFHTFGDISGDESPNTGTTAQTIDRLFGGNIGAWQEFDPRTVMTKHGHYENISGIFTVSRAHLDIHNRISGADARERDTAVRLCDIAAANGIHCEIVALTGSHNWPYAARAFALILPWLASQIGIA
jgi:S-formylglutathione hydrolase FrmB